MSFGYRIQQVIISKRGALNKFRLALTEILPHRCKNKNKPIDNTQIKNTHVKTIENETNTCYSTSKGFYEPLTHCDTATEIQN